METTEVPKTESRSLVKIMQDHFVMDDLLTETGGELDLTMEQWLEENKDNLGKKVDGYKSAMDILENAEAYLKDKAKPFLDAAKVCGNKREGLKERLKFAMKQLGVKEIVGNDYIFTLVNGANKVVVDNEDEIPAKFFVEPPPVISLDRDALKKALEANEGLEDPEEIRGAHLEVIQSVRSKVNATTIKPKKVKAPKEKDVPDATIDGN